MTLVDTIAAEYGWSVEDILDTTVARLRACLDSIQVRHKATYRATVALTEWSTKRIAMTVAATAGGEGSRELQMEIAKSNFPWEASPEDVAHDPGLDPNDLSFIETGDLSAADRNEGKNLGSLGLL